MAVSKSAIAPFTENRGESLALQGGAEADLSR